MTVEKKLHVLVVGAGFGGLGCAIACKRQGFDVTVFDKVAKFAPIGDSIGFGCNSARLLKRWGILDDMLPICSRVKVATIHDYAGKLLAEDPSQGDAEEEFGVPSLIGHRGHLHQIMLDHATKLGVEVRPGSEVVDYDSAKPSIILKSGQEITGDVVVVADGVRSIGKTAVLGYYDKPQHSGYAVWRAFADGTALRNDPLVQHLVKDDSLGLWIGPDIHALALSFQGGSLINMGVTHKDDTDIEEGWRVPAKKEDVMELIRDWDPAYKRLWEHTPPENILDWKLVYRPCLKKWVADSGLIAVMGDAAHPFLPSSSQGASQAIEDGATIALCLAKAESKTDIPLALHTFFEIRYEHVAAAQHMGIEQRDEWHHNHENGQLTNIPDFSKGMLKTRSLWGHDAEKVVEEEWDAKSALAREKYGI
ncbi:hypothetical protein N7457_000533 [Penicillium paradoxum]|uniref:uncharacterized protein n=1 Tax=Penicillium paradoxum TaxID=176176 RepID=UPI0025475463|nr:uncharacterized protein N7457_000533 [Penicillium paradoxum]KAJ5793934.1 hypothetical protein N7457_000533 [Penicillium paradoxum]